MITELFELADEEYRDFNSALLPTVPKERIIGVRTPHLRGLAKSTDESFLKELPHKYFEEDQIHAFMISEMKEFDRSVAELEVFLPYVDNWATCDQMSPKSFAKNKERLISHIDSWIASDHAYTVRFAVNMLMRHFLSDDFKLKYAQKVADIVSDHYYVNMARAWYFATALAKNWDETVSFVTQYRLDKWTHNKTIRKASESFRITKEQKEFLIRFKIRQ
ncbi:MAG: DNA alkylation repair protein [Clostridia bacterium]|nr:DNA alkylation repair protein [Clostridia bacterium]